MLLQDVQVKFTWSCTEGFVCKVLFFKGNLMRNDIGFSALNTCFD